VSEIDFCRSRIGDGDVRRLREVLFVGIRESRASGFRLEVDDGAGGVVGLGGIIVGIDSFLLSAAGPVGIDFGVGTEVSFAALACSLAAC
jgi:hypothetical protein